MAIDYQKYMMQSEEEEKNKSAGIDYQSYLSGSDSGGIDYSSYLSQQLPQDLPRNQVSTPEEVRNNLPSTFKVGFGDMTWDTGISTKGSEKLAAGLIGMGHMMTEVGRGVQQLASKNEYLAKRFNIDSEALKREEAIMDDLYNDPDLGTAATTGMVVGAIAEPVGLLLPGAKAGTFMKTLAKGAAISGAYGALAYTKEVEGEDFTETKAKQIALYGGIGAVAGGLFGGQLKKGFNRLTGKSKDIITDRWGDKINAAKYSRADQQLDNIDLAIAKKTLEDKPWEVIKQELKQEIPDQLEGLWDATKTVGRRPAVNPTKAEAQDIIEFATNAAKQNDIVAGADKIGGMLSTRLKNQSEMLYGRMQNFETNLKVSEHKAYNIVDKFMREARDTFGKGGPEAQQLKKYMLNGEWKQVENLYQSKGLDVSKLQDVRNYLQDQAKSLVDLGILNKKSILDNYFPRVVKDKEGLFKALGYKKGGELKNALGKANTKMFDKVGRNLNESEVSDFINRYLANKNMRGRGPFKSGYRKARTIDKIDDRLLQFYEDPLESLHTYIRNSTQDAKKWEFFGKHAVRKKGLEDLENEYARLDLGESIGNLVRSEMKAGNLTGTQADEVAKILDIRFNIGEQSPWKVTSAFKNLTYAALLANPISAAVQLGDVAISAYINGLMPTIKAIIPAAKKTLLAKPGKMGGYVKDLGLIDHVAEEFAGAGALSNGLKKAMQYSGFSKVDAFGKEVTLRAALNKATKQVATDDGMTKFVKTNEKIWGKEEAAQLANELRDGIVSERVNVHLFSELSRMQPVSKMELPEMYHRMPNGRIAYMLKSFILKQVDIARRDIVQKLSKEGTRAEGVANAVRLSLALGAGGTSAAVIQEYLKGNDKALEELTPADFGWNMIKTFGLTEYAWDKATKTTKDGTYKGTPAEALVGSFAPPVTLFDKLVQEDGYKYTPVAGKLLYYWAGDGLQKEMDRKKKREQRERGSNTRDRSSNRNDNKRGRNSGRGGRETSY